MKKISCLLLLVSFFALSCSRGTEKLVVASRQADCIGVAPQKCLLIKRQGSEGWEFWYSGITGFDYEEGYEYVIRIKKDKIDNPPADASSIKYTLKKVISKEKKVSENMPPI